jgi:hypothetical protein
MATLQTKERQTRRTTGAAPVEPGPERRGWVGLMIALVAAIAVAATLFVVFGGSDGGDVADARPAETETEALERLVNEGYIPKEALGGSAEANPSGADDPAGAPQDTTTQTPSEQELTERFQNEGLIPR